MGDAGASRGNADKRPSWRLLKIEKAPPHDAPFSFIARDNLLTGGSG
jgi:hypothetical protein